MFGTAFAKTPERRPETEDAMGDLPLIRLLIEQPCLTDDAAARELNVTPILDRTVRDATEGPLLLDYVQSLREGRG